MNLYFKKISQVSIGRIFFCILLLAPQFSIAKEKIDSFELSPEELFNATVTSVSKSPQKLFDAPAAVYVLTNEDIARSGATSIPEALRMVPGVDVARINASTWAVSIRGFNGALANKLLVLMDGREVYDPLFSGVYWDIRDTILEDVEKIEVIRGPGAALWGSNAVNGVINIITKKAMDTQGDLTSFIAGNQELITSERYGGKFGDTGYYRIYGKYRGINNERTLQGNNAQDDWQTKRAGFRADWNAHEDDELTLQGDIFSADENQFRNIPAITAPYSRFIRESIESTGGNITGTFKRKYGSDSNLTIKSYIDSTQRNQALLDDNRLTFDVDGQYEMSQNGRHKMIFGGKYRYSDENMNSPPFTTTTNFVTYPNNVDINQTISGFFQDKITLTPDKWFLTLGSKLEQNYYTGLEFQPDARLQWNINDDQMLWSAISYSVRTPSRLEHNLTIVQAVLPAALPSPAALVTQGNTAFESENSTSYQLGCRQQFDPDITLDVTTFYNVYDNLSSIRLPTGSGISFVSNGTDPNYYLVRLPFANDTHAETYGLENVVSWRAYSNLNLSASYSLLKLEFHGPAGNFAIDTEGPEKQSPQQQFSIRSQWDIKKNLSFDTMLYYVDELPAYHVQDYVRMDMRLGWKINEKLQFDLVGQNLLDNSHREFSQPTDINATEIERSIYGNITWHF